MSNIPPPSGEIYTVYTKTNCTYYEFAKLLLEDKCLSYVQVNCDEYLQTDRDLFLKTIREWANNEKIATFPMIFGPTNRDSIGGYIGGFKELRNFIEK